MRLVRHLFPALMRFVRVVADVLASVRFFSLGLLGSHCHLGGLLHLGAAIWIAPKWSVSRPSGTPTNRGSAGVGEDSDLLPRGVDGLNRDANATRPR